MKSDKITVFFKAAKIIAIVILASSFTFSLLSIPLWDWDFWWHIATGRYIVETGTIPSQDTFSYTSALAENKNIFPVWENFILKQYWFSQVIFYLIYDNSGAKGIIILRTSLLIATILLVFLTLRRWSVSFPLSFIFISTLFFGLTRATGERPVLFTVFFTALTFFIIEGFRAKKSKKIFLLIPLMLLWANMHGGFIIGVVIIIVFMAGEALEVILKRESCTRKDLYLFYTATVLAAGVSFLNPAGWDAFSIAANISSKYKAIHTHIQEYESPLTFYKYRVYPIQYSYVFLALLFPVIMLLRNKKMNLSHFFLLSGILIMSLSASRFVVYYMIIGTMILGKESDTLLAGLLQKRFSRATNEKIVNGLTVLVLVSIVSYVVGIRTFERVTYRVAKEYSVPEAAVDFIERNHLSGNMLNEYGYGGYITWRLYPWKKTFLDSRSLNITVRTEYGWIYTATEYAEEVTPKSKTPLWIRLLNHYKINFILLPVVDLYGQIPPLMFKLAESDKWIPVHCASISVIFVRNNDYNRAIIDRYKLSKDIIYNVIIYQSAGRALTNKINPRSLISIGDIFYEMGRLKDAVTAYRYAFSRMPEYKGISERIKKIETEIEKNKGGDKTKDEDK